MNKQATIYLADDHQIVIDGLKLLIGEESLKVIGSATDGETAMQELLVKRPDIALIDLRMPGMGGLELVIALKKLLPDTRFIILSMHDSQRDMRDAMTHGASGYLLKNVGKVELMKCLSLALKGEKYFPNIQTKTQQSDKPMFTPREAEIIKLILEDYKTAQIAAKLSLSPLTVEVHRKNIARKANTKSPIGISKYLHDNGIEL